MAPVGPMLARSYCSSADRVTVNTSPQPLQTNATSPVRSDTGAVLTDACSWAILPTHLPVQAVTDSWCPVCIFVTATSMQLKPKNLEVTCVVQTLPRMRTE